MSRLTCKIEKNYQTHYDVKEKYVDNPNSFSIWVESCEALKKLGQLEDIEEELGIDLITLFKAINGFGFWSIYGFEKIEECKIDFVLKCFITEDFNEIYFQDYGKTWALTEKELN